MIRPIAVAFVAVGLAVTWAEALDHKNLDAGRPLRVEDAYTIAAGEAEIEAGLGVAALRRGIARGLLPIEILYGLAPNFQAGIGTALATDPRTKDDGEHSGDLHLSALYNLNQETLALPAFGVKLDAALPTGVGAHGIDVGVKGIVTKSVDRLSTHLNAGYTFATDARGEERDGRYVLVLGASYPVGAPRYTRATIIADVFTEQAVRRADAPIGGAEIGFRYQLTPRLVWDAGMGTEFAGPRGRAVFTFTTGLSFGF
jgi:hypothetical protein